MNPSRNCCALLLGLTSWTTAATAQVATTAGLPVLAPPAATPTWPPPLDQPRQDADGAVTGSGGSGIRGELRAELGIGRLEIADQDGPALALRLRGSGSGQLLGFGADLFVTGSLGELGDLDAPGLAGRLQPFVSIAARSASDEWALRLRLGPEFVHFGAGDEVYLEYDGIGGRIDIDAQLRLSASADRVIEGYLGIGFGLGSGDVAGGIGVFEAEVEDDHSTIDIELGIGFRGAGTTFTVGFLHQEVALDETDRSYVFDGLMVGGLFRF